MLGQGLRRNHIDLSELRQLPYCDKEYHMEELELYAKLTEREHVHVYG